MPRSAPSKRSQQSQARNKDRIAAAVELGEEVEFGRIVRNLGGRNLLVLNQQQMECLAHIPGALAHRSSTPIVTGSIVVIVPRTYESRTKSEKRYDIFAVVQDKKDIRRAIKEGKIPEWLLNDSNSKNMEENIEFDYVTKDDDNDDEGPDDCNKDMDIDNI